MKLLVDVNVLLDVLQNRSDFLPDSIRVWKACEDGLAKGYVSSLAFADIVYIMRRQLDPSLTAFCLGCLSSVFEFTELSPSDLREAARLEWRDFEDAVQSVTAGRLRADYIITRNVRDFDRSRVPAVTPRELVLMLGQGVAGPLSPA